MKSFAATLFVVAAEASRPSHYAAKGYGGYGYSSSLQKVGYNTHVQNIPVTTYKNQQRAKTVLRNVQQKIQVPRNVQTRRTEYDTINQTVYDNLQHTVIDNVPRTVIDEITKTVIDNVPRTVIDKVQQTHIQRQHINQSDDSGDNYNSGDGIYVASVDSISSDSDSDCYGKWCNKKSYGGYGSYGHGWAKKAACHGWGCASSNDSVSSQSSYYITSDSSDDNKIIETPITTTRNVARTVIDKVPRQVKEQRARTVIDKIPRTVNTRVARNIQKRVPRTVIDNKTVYDTKIINKQVPHTVIENVRVPQTSYRQQITKTPKYARVASLHKLGGYSGYNKGYGYGKSYGY